MTNTHDAIAQRVGVQPFASNAFYEYELSGHDRLTCWLDTPIRLRIPENRITNPNAYADRTGDAVVCDICESRPTCTRCDNEQRSPEHETYCRPDTPHDYGDAR